MKEFRIGFGIDILLKKAESKLAAKLIERVAKAKRLPQEVFDVYQSTFGGSSLEVVPIHINDEGEISVFLITRDSTDKYFANEQHAPGTMIFPWDIDRQKSIAIPKARVLKGELGQDGKAQMVPVETLLLNTKRGAETALLHYVMVPDNLNIPNGKYYPADKLPPTTIDTHTILIREAVFDFVGSILTERLVIKGKENLSPEFIGRMMSTVTAIH